MCIRVGGAVGPVVSLTCFERRTNTSPSISANDKTGWIEQRRRLTPTDRRLASLGPDGFSQLSGMCSKQEFGARWVRAPTYLHVHLHSNTNGHALKFNYRALRNSRALIGFVSGRFLEMNRAEIHKGRLLISGLNEAWRRCHWQINAWLCPCVCVRALLWGPVNLCASTSICVYPRTSSDIGVCSFCPWS